MTKATRRAKRAPRNEKRRNQSASASERAIGERVSEGERAHAHAPPLNPTTSAATPFDRSTKGLFFPVLPKDAAIACHRFAVASGDASMAFALRRPPAP